MNHTLKILFRNLQRNKLISGINLIGLVIGIVSALFIFEYVFYERSYDTYHTNANDLYRVVYKRYNKNTLLWNTANSYYPMGSWLKTNYAEVENNAAVRRNYNIALSYKDELGNVKAYFEPKAYYASSSIFELFSWPLEQGESNCLDRANTVAISKSYAQKYFGGTNALGKTLTINKQSAYTVTAVFEDISNNSHLKSDLFFSLETVLSQRPNLRSNWAGDDLFHTYIRFKKGANVQVFKKTAIAVMENVYKDQLARMDQHDEVYLQSVPSIHLHSDIDFETEPPGSATNVAILFGFALLLLIVVWINYINLVTAQSVDRAKEIGIKKTNGANRSLLMLQFISETMVFNFMCLMVALVLFFSINPYFKSIAGIQDFNLFAQRSFLLILLILIPSGILISSIYPAFVLTAFNPAKVLKGKFKNNNSAMLLRKGLVTAQFVISLGLMIGAFVTFKQAAFLMEKDMGLSYNNTLVVRTPFTNGTNENRANKLNVIANKIEQMPEVSGYTLSSDAPGDQVRLFFGGRRIEQDRSHTKWYDRINVDHRFLDYYNMHLVAGRNFFEEEAQNHTIIIDQASVKRFGYANAEEAVNCIVKDNNDREFTIVGVVKDFHYVSVKMPTKPFVLLLEDQSQQFISLKTNGIDANAYSALLSKVERVFADVYPEQPFDYFVLDEKMRMYLKTDRTFVGVFSVFSVLAILLAVVGIIGLILIHINQNMKALGVRKALGASLNDVSIVLVKQLIVQFGVALVIALPLAYLGYEHGFLSSYIHRITLSPWYFIVPVLVLAAVIATVISIISNRVYRIDVSKVLKCE